MNRRIPSKAAAVATVLTLASTSVLLNTGPAAAANRAPAPPANLEIEGLEPDQFTVTWDPVTSAVDYRVTVTPLEPADGYARTTVNDEVVTLDDLSADIPYKVTVRAYVPSAYPNTYSETSAIIATTPLPDGYVFPTAPGNLRVVRDSTGTITQVRWDAPSQSFGPLTYRIHLESQDVDELNGIFGSTSELNFDGDALPLEPGAILRSGQSVTIRVTATDRTNNRSPFSQPLTLHCCPV